MKKKLIAMLLGLTAVVAQGSEIQELFSWDTVHAGTGSSYYGHVFDGQYSYHAFSNGEACVTRVDNATGQSSVLFTGAEWNLASGGTSTLVVFYGFGVSGDYLIWTDSGSDAIWKADKNTGEISSVVSKSALSSYTGSTVATGGSFSVAPNGGLTFYDSTSDCLLNVTLDGQISTVATTVDLDAYAGSAANINSGLTYDASGNLYWGNSGTDSIYSLSTDGSIGLVLGISDIAAVTSSATAYVNDIFYGEDGKIYFYDSISGNILSFDPENAAESLGVLVSKAEMDTAGIARAVTFGWYNDGTNDYLTFHEYNGSGLMGVAVPEPVTLILLGAGGLAVIRKKNRV